MDSLIQQIKELSQEQSIVLHSHILNTITNFNCCFRRDSYCLLNPQKSLRYKERCSECLNWFCPKCDSDSFTNKILNSDIIICGNCSLKYQSCKDCKNNFEHPHIHWKLCTKHSCCINTN